MTENVRRYLNVLNSRKYRKNRIDNDTDVTVFVNAEPVELSDTIVLEKTLEGECPVILEGDIFGFNRHQKNLAYDNWSDCVDVSQD